MINNILFSPTSSGKRVKLQDNTSINSEKKLYFRSNVDVVSFSGSNNEANKFSHKDVKQFFETFENSESSEVLVEVTDKLCNVYIKAGNKTKLEIEKFFLKQMRGEPANSKSRAAVSFFYNFYDKKEKDFNLFVEILNIINSSSNDINDPKYIKARENLFNQECLLLSQEVVSPEKYLDRALQMFATGNLSEDQHRAEYKLQKASLFGLYRLFNIANGLGIKLSKIDFNELSKSVLDTVNKPSKELLKPDAQKALVLIYDKLNSKQKKKVENFAMEIIKTSSSDDAIQQAVNFFSQSVDKSKPVIKELQEYFLNKFEVLNSVEEKRKHFVALAKLESKEVPALINDILSDSKSDALLKVAATWAAGFYPGNENFKALKDIVLNYDSNLQLKEMALYSISEYKNKRAVDFVKAIKESGSEFSELAEALMEKLNKTLEKDSSYYLNMLIKTNKEKLAYIENRNQYVKGFESFTNAEKNRIDKALIPFRKVLEDAVEKGHKFTVLNDITTSLEPHTRGQRLGYGFFFDAANGLGGNNVTITRPMFSDALFGPSITSHEWGHIVNFYLNEHYPELGEKIEELYNNAKQEDRIMDYYADNNYMEYFAQGMDAYLKAYVPHMNLIDTESYLERAANTNSYLKRKDPELFKFIDNLYKEFIVQNIAKDNLDVVA